MPGEARHVQGQPLELEPVLHIAFAEPARRHFVLDDGEPEIGALAEEERRSLGPREPARLRHDPLEDGGELPVAADRDPELQQLLEHLRPTLCRGLAKHLEEAPNPRTRVWDVHAQSGEALRVPGARMVGRY